MGNEVELNNVSEDFFSDEDIEFFNFLESEKGIPLDYKKKLKYASFFQSFKIESGISLNNEQKFAVIYDTDVLQIVAGAGTGKTTTLVAKIKYLIDVKGVDPSKILCLSFSNASVNDFNNQLNDVLSKDRDYDEIVSTFHSFAYSFSKENKKVLDDEEKRELLLDSFKSFIIEEISTEKTSKSIPVYEKFLLHFPYIFNRYFEIPRKEKNNILIKNKGNYSYYFVTLEETIEEVIDNENTLDKYFNFSSNFDEKSTNKVQNRKPKIVYSYHDLKIANFLTLHNIQWEYSKEYKFKENTVQFDFYLPEYGIYIEDEGLDNFGNPNNLRGISIKRFKEQLQIKKEIVNHDKENRFIFINSLIYPNDFLDFLENQLKSLIGDFDRKKLSNRYFERILKRNKFLPHLNELYDLFRDFIKSFKQQGYDESKIDSFKGDGEREIFFLEMISKYYKFYQKLLNENNYIDYEDMITKSLDNIENTGFEYIFVDEYQDMSEIRLKLLKKVYDDTNAKLIVVGDDWQSIYGFNGCKVDYFLDFEQNFDGAERICLKETHRFTKNLITLTEKFITADNRLLEKELIPAKKHIIEKPVVIKYYSFKKDQYILVYEVLKEISEDYKNGNLDDNTVLILSRYNKHIDDLKPIFDKIKVEDELDLKIEYQTIHRSKGLGRGTVILLNVNNKGQAIPSKVPENPLLLFVSFYGDDNERINEERRLFYVALTRTKNKVYLVTKFNEESSFIGEILRYNQEFIHKGNKGLIQKDISFKHDSCYNPFYVRKKDMIKKFWKCRDIEFKSNVKCPKCGKGSINLYKINREYYLVCSEFEECEEKFFIADEIIFDDDFCVGSCPNCDGILYKKHISGINRICCSNKDCLTNKDYTFKPLDSFN